MADYEVGYGKPPKSAQFGQPNGNKSARGAWKKEETARWKFEQLIKKTEEELNDLLNDEQSCFDIGIVNGLLQIKRLTNNLGKLIDELEKETDVEKKIKLTSYCMTQIETLTVIQEKQMNQIYGMPKQQLEQTNIEAPAPRLPKNKSEE